MTSKKKQNGLFSILFVIIGLYSLHLLGEFPSVKETVTGDNQDKVFVMYAGSLVKIFEDIIGPVFQSEFRYPYVGEGKGSVQGSNLIKDGLRTPDVFVSAGSVPMTRLMNTTPPIVNWLLKFGSAEIVIAYSPNSPHFGDLERARMGEIPWYDVVSWDGFKFGRTDPELDPKGYYGIITAELANTYYNDLSIKDRVFGEDRNPRQIFPEEILKTVLETGQLDAVVAYKHEAISRDLPYITLPKEINLGDPIYSDTYKLANYTLQSDQKTIYGDPIDFSITIPKTVKNMDGAISFVNFVISKNGSQLLESQGLNPINITSEGNTDDIPFSIREAIP
ncbi:extracellular solute-binding protein [Candidatus Nitrosocosmicus sp. T]